ncbi:MAG TPA: dATP/dGTP pyrophosphohydrolase domain-containing protein [Puia sp.]|nr:dATP/dGTP pyrophosphohydrolase domain-containing protein [Puia sp.]
MEKTKIRRCYSCGCTDDDCSQCIEKTGEPCRWISETLCSACYSNPDKTLECIFTEFRQFCAETYPLATEASCLEKLKHEAEELSGEVWRGERKESEILEEYVDCLMCLLDGMRRGGFTIENMRLAFLHKLAKNQKRDWIHNPKDNTYSHKKVNA